MKMESTGKMEQGDSYKFILNHLGMLENTVITDIGEMRTEDAGDEKHITSKNIVRKFLTSITCFDYRAVSLFMHLNKSGTLQQNDTTAATSARTDASNNASGGGWLGQATDPNQGTQPLPETNVQQDINWLDALLVILFHCDPIARQRILECMSSCHLAVPVLLPNLADHESIFLQWGLSAIMKTKVDKSMIEVSATRHPFPVIFFFTLGKIEKCSVPNILNNIMGEQQGNSHPYYFLQDENSSESKLSNGLLEAVWFIPKVTSNFVSDREIKTSICFQYLRGHANTSSKVFKLAWRSANLMVVFINRESLQSCSNTINMLAEQTPIILSVRSPTRYHKGDIIDKNIKVKEFSACNEREIAVSLCKEITKFFEKDVQGKFSLNETFNSTSQEEKMKTDMDQLCQESLDKALSISETLHDDLKKFSEIFPFMTGFETISKIARDKTWKQPKPGVDASSRLEEKLDKMKEQRREQVKNQLSTTMQAFLEFMKGSCHFRRRVYFISWLKTLLKEKASPNLEYGSAKGELSGEIYSTDDFLRELGQYYESHFFVGSNQSFLPDIAASIVLNGHPLEVLHGSTGNIPIKWIEGIINSLISLVGNVQIYVISVIGMQSGGKSTFLNAMFGTSFKVGAGPVTKGIYFQMVKIEESLRPRLRCDYLLIFDTAGLNPHKEVCDLQNEIATFVLCLSNYTFLNVSGQTVDDNVSNVLQIAAHAFIRMNQVNLRSDCFLVQQQVGDPTVLKKNKGMTSLLQTVLDKAVRTAAKIEGKEKMFKSYDPVFNIQNFEEESDLQYIPPLWASESMNPPGTGYSEKIYRLKAKLFNIMQSSSENFLTLSKFIRRLVDVWNAVKEEDFVFHFQNLEEIEQFMGFRERYHQICINFLKQMMDWKFNALQKVLTNKSSVANVVEKMQTELKCHIGTEEEKILEKMNQILNEKKYNLIRKETKNFQIDFKERVKNVETDISDSLVKRKELCLSEISKVKDKLEDDILREVSIVTAKLLTKDYKDDDHTEQFNKIWKKSVSKARENYFARRNKKEALQNGIDKIWACINHLYKHHYLEKHLRSKQDIILNCQNLQQLIEGTYDDIFAFLKSHKFWGEIDETLLGDVKRHISVLQSKLKSNEIFDITCLHQILPNLSSCINNLKEEYLSGLILHVCLWVTSVLHTQKVDFDWDTIHRNVTERREFYLSSFNSELKNGCKAQTLFRAMLQPALASVVNEKVISTLLENFRLSIFMTKQKLLEAVLVDVTTNNCSFETYKKYIKENSAFLNDWVLKHLTKLCVDDTLKEYFNIKDSAKSVINQNIENITKLVKEWSSQESKQQKPFKDICGMFFKKMESTLSISCNDSKAEEYQNTVSLSVQAFSESCLLILRDIKVNLLKDLDLPQEPYSETNVEKWFVNTAQTHKVLIQNLGMCSATCPYCKVRCDETDVHDIHKSVRHLPLGLSGYHKRRPPKYLLSDSCSARVATDILYYNCNCDPDQCKHEGKYYKHYKTYHPDWYIKPADDIEDQPINYWKWVLKEFNEDFAKHYNKEKAKVPDSWTGITKSNAMESLSKL